jgi:hypothetical protein
MCWPSNAKAKLRASHTIARAARFRKSPVCFSASLAKRMYAPGRDADRAEALHLRRRSLVAHHRMLGRDLDRPARGLALTSTVPATRAAAQRCQPCIHAFAVRQQPAPDHQLLGVDSAG